ncbi:hypothetical protein [Halalkalibacter urbisdiaboli]|uniref:hypothetical protein n=1 Tax=Halalkalibacter urbisdiaboli TaxID=1960589 RepID=UPI000B440123|nr:hypothetical protein [Halalkalibacter urbisdiaboli]
MINQLSKLEELKRKLYLFTLPIIIVALVSSFFYYEEHDPFNSIVLPLLTLTYSISWFLVYYRKWFKYVELVNLFLISMIHLLKNYEIVYVEMAIKESILQEVVRIGHH